MMQPSAGEERSDESAAAAAARAAVSHAALLSALERMAAQEEAAAARSAIFLTAPAYATDTDNSPGGLASPWQFLSREASSDDLLSDADAGAPVTPARGAAQQLMPELAPRRVPCDAFEPEEADEEVNTDSQGAPTTDEATPPSSPSVSSASSVDTPAPSLAASSSASEAPALLSGADADSDESDAESVPSCVSAASEEHDDDARARGAAESAVTACDAAEIEPLLPCSSEIVAAYEAPPALVLAVARAPSFDAYLKNAPVPTPSRASLKLVAPPTSSDHVAADADADADAESDEEYWHPGTLAAGALLLGAQAAAGARRSARTLWRSAADSARHGMAAAPLAARAAARAAAQAVADPKVGFAAVVILGCPLAALAALEVGTMQRRIALVESDVAALRQEVGAVQASLQAQRGGGSSSAASRCIRRIHIN